MALSFRLGAINGPDWFVKVLVACEFSGVVRRAFRARGHEAFSCDIVPSTDNSPWHYQCDVREILQIGGWDLIIGHPPCTDISVSGALHFKAKIADGRQARAIEFFMLIANADCPKVVVENPVCIMSSVWRKPDQIIQPYQYGEDASKKTCLWLRGVPKLVGTKRIAGRLVEYPPGSGKCLERWDNQTDSGQNKLGPSETRAADRAVTYPGIAEAMADQWSRPDPQGDLLFTA